MKKRLKQTAGILLVSGLFLTACGKTETKIEEPETEQSSTASAVYQNMLDEAKKQFEKGEFDAAAGTLSILFNNDLSGDPSLEKEAKELQRDVNQAQAKDEKSEKLAQTAQDSKYKTERYSSLAAKEFEQDTGKDITEVEDADIEEWLSAKQVEDDRRVSSKDSDEDAKDETVEEMEEQEQVLKEVTETANLNPEGYEFFIIKTDDHEYQIEIRQPHEVDGVEVSNMIGIFRYDFESKMLEKMDPVTGEYDLYTNEKL